MYWVLGVGNAQNAEQFIQEGWRLPQPVRGEFMTIAEQLKAIGREEGREKGLEEGLEQGEDKALKRVAANSLKEGVEPQFVAKITGLSLQTVLEIKSQLDDN